MTGINLILSDQLDRQKPLLRITKSGTNQICPIPYHMDSYTPLTDSLQNLIPEEWQTTIENLRNEERALIKKRQLLMAEYKLALIPLVTLAIESYKKENPEMFI